MRRCVTLFVLFVCLSSRASAGILLQVSSVSVESPTQDTLVYPEIYVVENAPSQPEGIAAFNLPVRLHGGSAGGVRFFPDSPSVPVPRALIPVEHPYFFANTRDRSSDEAPVRPIFPQKTTDYYRPDFLSMLANANLGLSAQLSPGDGVLRLPILIPAGTPAGQYEVDVAPTGGGFAEKRGQTNFVEVPFFVSSGFVVITPEPATAGWCGLLAIGSLLRRRRR